MYCPPYYDSIECAYCVIFSKGILCDHQIFLKLIEKFYKTVMRLVMFYGSECSTVKKQHI